MNLYGKNPQLFDMSKATTAIAQYTDFSDNDKLHTLHFSSWWSGEGADIRLNDQRFELTLTDMEYLVKILIATEFVDIDIILEELKSDK